MIFRSGNTNRIPNQMLKSHQPLTESASNSYQRSGPTKEEKKLILLTFKINSPSGNQSQAIGVYLNFSV